MIKVYDHIFKIVLITKKNTAHIKQPNYFDHFGNFILDKSNDIFYIVFKYVSLAFPHYENY